MRNALLSVGVTVGGGNGVPDAVREAFGTWARVADPEEKMDVYQIARACARDHGEFVEGLEG